MFFRAIAGLVAGLCAGVVSGILYLVMTMPDVDGIAIPLLTVVARAVGFNDPSVGWSFHLFNATIAGVIFGFLFGRTAVTMPRSIMLGLVVGLVWWLISAVFVLPTLVQQEAFYSAYRLSTLHPVMIGTLIGSVIYGVLLGAVYLFVYGPAYAEDLREQEEALEEQRLSERIRSDRERTAA
jgi:hypothetical protein